MLGGSYPSASTQSIDHFGVKTKLLREIFTTVYLLLFSLDTRVFSNVSDGQHKTARAGVFQTQK